MTGRAELIKRCWRKFLVELAKYEACNVHAESWVMALEDELLDQADHNSRLIWGMCLLEHAYRRERHSRSTDLPILDGLSLPRTAGPPFRTCESILSAPPPTPSDKWTDNLDMFIDYARPKDEAPWVSLC
jgi:hypothetical protein